MKGLSIGMLLLAIWLVLFGAVQAFALSFNGSHIVLGGLAIAAGVAILIRR